MSPSFDASDRGRESLPVVSKKPEPTKQVAANNSRANGPSKKQGISGVNPAPPPSVQDEEVFGLLLDCPVGDLTPFRAHFEHGVSNASDATLRRVMDVLLRIGGAVNANDKNRMDQAAAFLETIVGLRSEAAAIYGAYRAFERQVQRSQKGNESDFELWKTIYHLGSFDPAFRELPVADVRVEIEKVLATSGKVGASGVIGGFAAVVSRVGAFGLGRANANDAIRRAIKASKGPSFVARSSFDRATISEGFDGPLKPSSRKKRQA